MDEAIPLLASYEDSLDHEEDVELVSMATPLDETKINIDIDDDERSVLQAPALPESKLYHLFVCYATKDRNRAFEIVSELESRNVKCVFADRDFRPGKEISLNIMEGINNSVKILTILSPRFTESRYCLHESEIAFQKSMETGLNYVIPVLLEACEVPYGLKPKSYIDATLPGVTVVDVTDRIVSALQLPGGLL